MRPDGVGVGRVAVREEAGDEVRLTVLIPPGAEAHDFEPDPQAVKRVHHARLVLKNGIGLDEWISSTVENAGGGARRYLACANAAVLVERDDAYLAKLHDGWFAHPHDITIVPVDSHPIVAECGLASGSLRSSLAFWCKMDFVMEAGKVVAGG